jgi:hypothetical protein
MNFTGQSGDLTVAVGESPKCGSKSMNFMVVQIDFMANFKCLWALAHLTDRISPYVRDRIEDCSLRFSSMLLGELFVHSRSAYN